MARIWLRAHRKFCGAILPRESLMVYVASFTFAFGSVQQLRDCIAYYESKTHPSSIIPEKRFEEDLGSDWRSLRGWDIPRWFERLPMYLLEEPKRQKVLKALNKALAMVESGKLDWHPIDGKTRHVPPHPGA